MAGTIYCFNTIVDAKIYKAGHTQQDLAARLRGYLGPSKPRTIVAQRQVDDSVAAETMMLGLLRQCCALRTRPDLGPEWFGANESMDTDEIQRCILFVFDVVGKAVRCSRDPPHASTISSNPPSTEMTTLPAMGAYFEGLDRFMQRAMPNYLQTLEHAIREFERSNDCPVFSEYVLWPRSTRVAVARNRYPQLS